MSSQNILFVTFFIFEALMTHILKLAQKFRAIMSKFQSDVKIISKSAAKILSFSGVAVKKSEI